MGSWAGEGQVAGQSLGLARGVCPWLETLVL